MTQTRQKPNPTVFVVDDNEASRHSLSMLVETVALHVESYAHPEDFLSAFDASRAGCVILDMRLPGMSGIDVLGRIREQKSEIPVLVVTAYGDIPTAVLALKRGAVDFIEKPFSDQLILTQIQQCVKDDMARYHARSLTEDIRRRAALLSTREREILSLITAGQSSRQIAHLLKISPRTVENHRARVREKMAACSVAELITMTQYIK